MNYKEVAENNRNDALEQISELKAIYGPICVSFKDRENLEFEVLCVGAAKDMAKILEENEGIFDKGLSAIQSSYNKSLHRIELSRKNKARKSDYYAGIATLIKKHIENYNNSIDK